MDRDSDSYRTWYGVGYRDAETLRSDYGGLGVTFGDLGSERVRDLPDDDARAGYDRGGADAELGDDPAFGLPDAAEVEETHGRADFGDVVHSQWGAGYRLGWFDGRESPAESRGHNPRGRQLERLGKTEAFRNGYGRGFVDGEDMATPEFDPLTEEEVAAEYGLIDVEYGYGAAGVHVKDPVPPGEPDGLSVG